MIFHFSIRLCVKSIFFLSIEFRTKFSIFYEILQYYVCFSRFFRVHYYFLLDSDGAFFLAGVTFHITPL